MTLPRIDIDHAVTDAQLLGAALGAVGTWQTWRAVLKAAWGIELNRDEARAFAGIAGGRKAPERRVRELWCIIGRRSGKSRMAALIAVFVATLVDHAGKLAPGEAGTILILAASKVQAHTVFGYVRAFLEESPILRQMVEDVTADEIKLTGNIVIGVHTNNYRTVRGRTLLAVIFDEVGFWRDETTSLPDVETYRAVLPALATTNGMLVGISSPYAQRGLLYTKHRDAFGKDDADVLVVQAGTVSFNPTIDPTVIANAERDDPEAAAAEWHAQFRGDLSTFVDRAVVEACVESGVRERPFDRELRYTAFLDSSSGQHDSMALALSHRAGERVVLDLVREWRAPFSPSDVIEEIVQVLRAYRVTSAFGDAYSTGFVRDAFRQHGITYRLHEQNRSEIYLAVLPLLMARNAVLLDHPGLVAQLSQLERRTGRTGRDAVDHMRGARDDVANAAAGALVRGWETRSSSAMPFGGTRLPRVVQGYEHIKKRHGRSRVSSKPQASIRDPSRTDFPTRN